jgi:hypothetical protein
MIVKLAQAHAHTDDRTPRRAPSRHDVPSALNDYCHTTADLIARYMRRTAPSVATGEGGFDD